MAVTFHGLRVGPSDMYLTRKVFLNVCIKDTLFKGMHQGEPRPVPRGRVSDCTFTTCKHPDCFPILHVRKIYFDVISDVFRCPCYALIVMSNRWNQYNFSTPHPLYVWGHSWILVLLLIFVDWYKHSNANFAGSMCILNRFWCIIWRPKAIFLSKCVYYIMGYIINWGSIFFLFPLILNLAYIDHSLCQIWSIYTQYFLCCDHSNKCLFLVIQQAEVLLNFLVSVPCVKNRCS